MTVVWENPIFVRELRRSSRQRMTLGLPCLLAAAGDAALIAYLSRFGSTIEIAQANGLKQDCFLAYSMWLTVQGIFAGILPAIGVQLLLRRELREQSLRMLLLTSLSPLSFIWGLVGIVTLQAALQIVLMLPVVSVVGMLAGFTLTEQAGHVARLLVSSFMVSMVFLVPALDLQSVAGVSRASTRWQRRLRFARRLVSYLLGAVVVLVVLGALSQVLTRPAFIGKWPEDNWLLATSVVSLVPGASLAAERHLPWLLYNAFGVRFNYPSPWMVCAIWLALGTLLSLIPYRHLRRLWREPALLDDAEAWLTRRGTLVRGQSATTRPSRHTRMLVQLDNPVLTRSMNQALGYALESRAPWLLVAVTFIVAGMAATVATGSSYSEFILQEVVDGIVAMFVGFLVIFLPVRLIADWRAEQTHGTLDLLRLTPMPRRDLLFGKVAVPALMCFLTLLCGAAPALLAGSLQGLAALHLLRLALWSFAMIPILIAVSLTCLLFWAETITCLLASIVIGAGMAQGLWILIVNGQPTPLALVNLTFALLLCGTAGIRAARRLR